MQRIAIIGCGGAGKSTLARQVGAMLNIDVFHLDAMHWKPGWVESERDTFAATQRELVQRESWIIDGNYSGTLAIRLAAADTVIFLDLPRRVCLFRVFRRVARYHGRVRPDMGAGCPEHWPDMAFLSWIWGFRRHTRPGLIRTLEQLAGTNGEKTILRLRSPREVRRFLHRLARTQAVAAESERLHDMHPKASGTP